MRAVDVIPGVLTAHTMPPVPRETDQPATVADDNTITLPQDFTGRIRRLPCRSKLHVPVEFRMKHALAWNQALEGIAAKVPAWCKLEEARTKLLLSEAPEGADSKRELAERFRLWSDGRFSELLDRAEQQHVLNRRPAKRAPKGKKRRTDRARMALYQTGEGAYRKALGTLTSEMAQMSATDEQAWARELLPAAERTDALYVLDALPHDVEMASASNVEFEHPLEGIHYRPITAPRPTGTRPEHAKEALGIRQKAIARKLARSMRDVQQMAIRGELPCEARWLTRTRLCYLKKKGSHKPRPVRIGEFLRSSTAKKTMRKAAIGLRPICRKMHQWGVEMPGGCEALVHWRSNIRGLALKGKIGPIVEFDLDLENMFCRIEWSEIRAAARKHFEEAVKCIESEHAEPGEVVLPSGDSHMVDRGAGQGDVFGSTSSSLALGHIVQDAFIGIPGIPNTGSVPCY